MSQQIINVGSAPNDGTGDVLRVSQQKANANFTELYNSLGDDVLVTNASVSGTYNLDFSKDTFELTLVGNTTLTVSNLPSTGNTKVISVYMTGNFAVTYPSGFTTRIVGTYNGAKNNLLAIEYRGATNAYWVTIVTAP
jgi:hypothetical protein